MLLCVIWIFCDIKDLKVIVCSCFLLGGVNVFGEQWEASELKEECDC